MAVAQPEPRGRVLVCDDSATIRLSIQEMLGGRYECCLVESGERALDVFDAFRPDLVITDRVMGGIDGFELCRRLRAQPDRADVPIVLLTTRTGADERAQGLELGADDYLFKPVRERELLARVASLIKLRQATLGLKARTAELQRAHRELTDAQATIVHNEKLATLGTLAAGLAHEINNPLAFMKPGLETLVSCLGALAATPAAPAAVREMLEICGELSQGLARIARVVHDLRDFAADRDAEPSELDLRDEIERAWKMVLLHAVAHVRLKVDVGAGLTLVALRSKLSHVLLNLFLSAVQAGGSEPVTIRLAARLEGDSVVMSVSDDGPAVPQDLRERIFDPFVSRRGGGPAAGLGLSVSQGIVRALGGSLELGPAGERGATFLLRLPTGR